MSVKIIDCFRPISKFRDPLNICRSDEATLLKFGVHVDQSGERLYTRQEVFTVLSELCLYTTDNETAESATTSATGGYNMTLVKTGFIVSGILFVFVTLTM